MTDLVPILKAIPVEDGWYVPGPGAKQLVKSYRWLLRHPDTPRPWGFFNQLRLEWGPGGLLYAGLIASTVTLLLTPYAVFAPLPAVVLALSARAFFRLLRIQRDGVILRGTADELVGVFGPSMALRGSFEFEGKMRRVEFGMPRRYKYLLERDGAFEVKLLVTPEKLDAPEGLHHIPIALRPMSDPSTAPRPLPQATLRPPAE